MHLHYFSQIEILKSCIFLTQCEVNHAVLIANTNENLSSQHLETTKLLLDKSLALLFEGLILLPATEEKSNLIILFIRENYLKKFEDFKYFSLQILSFVVQNSLKIMKVDLFYRNVLKETQWKQIEESSKATMCKNLLDLVAEMSFDPSKDFYFVSQPSRSDDNSNTKRKKLHSLSTPFSTLTKLESYKSAFSNFWVQFLSIPSLPQSIYQQVLMKMDDHIIPNFSNPFLLNDFISSSFGKGGLITMLSIKSLFTLIEKYNLFVVTVDTFFCS